MKFISCENMRRLVVLSVTLLGVGIVLFALFMLFGKALGGVYGLSLLYLSFALIVSSPLVLLINFFLSLLPGSRQLLEQCNH